MKKLYLTLFSLSLLFLTAKSQTTDEEYRMITKSLKMQGGLVYGLSEGYTLDAIGTYTEGDTLSEQPSYRFDFYHLKKGGYRRGVVVKRSVNDQGSFGLLPTASASLALKAKSANDFGVGRDVDYAAESRFADYLAAFSRAMIYLTQKLAAHN